VFLFFERGLVGEREEARAQLPKKKKNTGKQGNKKWKTERAILVF